MNRYAPKLETKTFRCPTAESLDESIWKWLHSAENKNRTVLSIQFQYSGSGDFAAMIVHSHEHQ